MMKYMFTFGNLWGWLMDNFCCPDFTSFEASTQRKKDVLGWFIYIYIYIYISDHKCILYLICICIITYKDIERGRQEGTTSHVMNSSYSWLMTPYHSPASCQWPFQEPKWEVPTIYKAYFLGLNFREYPHKIGPYMVLTYLHELDPEDLPLILWAKGDCQGIQQGVLQPLCLLDPRCLEKIRKGCRQKMATDQMGVSENVVYPIVPNGFADHYPY